MFSSHQAYLTSPTLQGALSSLPHAFVLERAGPVSCERQVLLWLQPLLPPPPVPSLTLSWPQPQQALTGAHGLEQGAAVAGAHVLLPPVAEGQAGKPGLGVVKPSDGGCIAATALATTPAMSTHLQSSTGHAQVQASGGGGMGDAAELGAAGTATADAPASLAGVGAGQGAALLPSIKFQVASQVLRLNSELQYPGLCPCHGLPLLPHLPSLQLGERRGHLKNLYEPQMRPVCSMTATCVALGEPLQKCAVCKWL